MPIHLARTVTVAGLTATVLLSPVAARTALAAPGATPPAAVDAPVIIAHRGASGYAPENTLAAAEAAARLDTAWVETDVQRTADGALVLMHDTTLARTTNVEEVFPDRAPWNVSDFTAEEIEGLEAGSWFGEEFAGEPVPTLGDFLAELAENGQRLLLELKQPQLYPGIEAEVLAELAAEGWLDEETPGERLVVQSFSADSVRTVHELAPAVKTGFLGTPAESELAAYASFTDQVNPTHGDLTADYVRRVQALTGPHGEPMEVSTWTVNDAETAVEVAGYGVDGIITNFPDVVREAVGG
ncbi:glycerophosphodiester phosphodiesterase [Streptomyces sp. 4N509B]|uniref:glycerophosphodiester phosphodiesterase n=1 Tax=Streptomyces sp. 4N509B TaxID=3457413 RepID=UPI003FD63E65